jgi:hypothetical protein
MLTWVLGAASLGIGLPHYGHPFRFFAQYAFIFAACALFLAGVQTTFLRAFGGVGLAEDFAGRPRRLGLLRASIALFNLSRSVTSNATIWSVGMDEIVAHHHSAESLWIVLLERFRR